ncbi:hypothetical protein C2S52_011747 [Perilla frutescens var. hirtella]|nr:hypothetical protein C2S52_011747 [Perilla frutescens var. hirtella]
MSKSEVSKLSLNVMIDKEKSKVLFAEANGHVIDVLLSFVTLPLGKIVKILENHYGNQAPVIGSLTSLYRGLFKLDRSHFCTGGAKQMLLNPTSSFEDECRRLKLDITEAKPTKYFVCENAKCPNSRGSNVSMYSDISKCDCGKPLNREVVVVDRLASDGGGVFTIKSSSFVICDDLRVVPIESGYIQTLNNIGITDTDGAEFKRLSLGVDDIVDLLKFALIFPTPLTDFVFKNSHMRGSTTEESEPKVEAEPELLLHLIDRGGNISSSMKKIMLKIFLKKSSNSFLFAQASDEFVEFLLSLLVVPLGGVEFLLGGNTCLKNIDNLYRSVTDFIDDKYFRSPHTKSRLINPKLPHGYISENQFLPLGEEDPPDYITRIGGMGSGMKGFLTREKGICMALSVCFLNRKGVPLSDVEEMVLQISPNDALGILKASLTSTAALTDSLIDPMLQKR